MTSRDRSTLVAGLAVALTSSALAPLFVGLHWVLPVLGAVAVVAVAGALVRRRDLATWVPPVVELAALGLYLAVVFAAGSFTLGVVPGPRTVLALNDLLVHARTDIAQLGAPVPTHQGLVLLSAGGVGFVAVVVDLIAVTLGQAAVAGVPLLVLFVIPSSVLSHGLGWLPFALGGIGWLAMLLVEGGERVGHWGTTVQAWADAGFDDDSSLGRSGRRIGAAALGMAVVVPVLLPGLNTQLLGGGGTGGTGGKGHGARATETYNPITRLRDELNLPAPRQLLVYTTTDPAPDYLRMTTLDQFSVGGWSSSQLRGDPRDAQVGNGIHGSAAGADAEHKTFTMKIGIDTLDVRWLPVPFGPRKVKVNGSWLWDGTSETVFSATRTTHGLKAYTVNASRVVPDRTQLAASDEVEPSIRARYLPPIVVAPGVRRLVQRVINGKTSSYDKAKAIQAYFRDPASGFTYSLDATQGGANDRDPLSGFLATKQGFCEQYASAMAAMLRVAGVPSRVAVGFTPGTKVTQTGTWQVTTSDAHAWPEAWFAGAGWVRFEPTPSASRSVVPAYSVPPTTASDPTAVTPGAGTGGAAATRPTGAHNPEALLGGAANRYSSTGTSRSTSHRSTSWWLVGGVGVLLLAGAPAALHAVRRRRRRRRWDPVAAWQQVQDDAYDVGHRGRPSDSPRAAATRLGTERVLGAAAAAALQRLAAAAERQRYARPSAEPDPAASLKADVAAVRSGLLAASSARVRWRARLVPPATLAWAGSTAGAALADGLDRVDRLFATAGGRLRRRSA